MKEKIVENILILSTSRQKTFWKLLQVAKTIMTFLTSVQNFSKIFLTSVQKFSKSKNASL